MDDECSVKAISVNIDKNIKGHGRKVAARGRVDDGKATSKGVTTKAKLSKKCSGGRSMMVRQHLTGALPKPNPPKKSLQRRQW